MTVSTKPQLKVADEVWIVTALLHREHPELVDFSVDEIVELAERQNLYASLRPGVYVRVVQHCVANQRPNPGRYRMLVETRAGRRRLFRAGGCLPSRERRRQDYSGNRCSAARLHRPAPVVPGMASNIGEGRSKPGWDSGS